MLPFKFKAIYNLKGSMSSNHFDLAVENESQYPLRFVTKWSAVIM